MIAKLFRLLPLGTLRTVSLAYVGGTALSLASLVLILLFTPAREVIQETFIQPLGSLLPLPSDLGRPIRTPSPEPIVTASESPIVIQLLDLAAASLDGLLALAPSPDVELPFPAQEEELAALRELELEFSDDDEPVLQNDEAEIEDEALDGPEAVSMEEPSDEAGAAPPIDISDLADDTVTSAEHPTAVNSPTGAELSTAPSSAVDGAPGRIVPTPTPRTVRIAGAAAQRRPPTTVTPPPSNTGQTPSSASGLAPDPRQGSTGAGAPPQGTLPSGDQIASVAPATRANEEGSMRPEAEQAPVMESAPSGKATSGTSLPTTPRQRSATATPGVPQPTPTQSGGLLNVHATPTSVASGPTSARTPVHPPGHDAPARSTMAPPAATAATHHRPDVPTSPGASRPSSSTGQAIGDQGGGRSREGNQADASHNSSGNQHPPARPAPKGRP
jgi:hypothetical protein